MTDCSDFPQQVASAAAAAQTAGSELSAAQPADKQAPQGLLFLPGQTEDENKHVGFFFSR